ncbi:uncharacterized protein SCHCODRAFT_02671224 [Schizophyllum commune H4-8]|nr:uncharacterized protein SCHCODRAFT_02671224 [Schizophyllum commune H4-8]KAI5888664.1 hypothetical protein SCHCODRAFT_02671224 [Schizophyllum commune H4-8]
MYKFAVAIVAAFAVFFGQASAATLLADNPAVDACNGSNHYGEGHDCAFKSADGTAEGVCHKDGSGVLTCVTNQATLTNRTRQEGISLCGERRRVILL